MSDGPNDGLNVTHDGGVLTLRIDRPDAHNALDHTTRTRLVEELEAASEDLAVRSVLLTATGSRAFCTGADLRTRPPGPDRPQDAPDRAAGDVARLIRTGWQRLIAAVLDCEKPVIAAVNGTAAGAGAHLALACDLVVAGESARFIEVFVRRGLAPDAGGCWLLPRLVGLHVAKALVFFGDDLPAAEAARLGLINAVRPDAELLPTAQEWAARLAAGPTVALGAAKRLLNRSAASDRETAFAEEAWAQEAIAGTQDMREGLAAFAEKRPPVFRGW